MAKENKKTSPDQMVSQTTARRYGILVLIFTLVIWACLYWISPMSRIEWQEVHGNQEIGSAELLKASVLKEEDYVLASIPKFKDVEASLKEKFAQVKNVDIQVKNLNQVHYQIEEYETIAYLNRGQKYYPVIETGEWVDRPKDITTGNHIILRGFEDAGQLKQMVDELMELSPAVKEYISEIVYQPNPQNENRVFMYMNDGNQAYASIHNFSDRMKYYPAISEEIGDREGVVHLETGAYFQPFESGSENQVDQDLSLGEGNPPEEGPEISSEEQ